jgi:putative transposase
MRRAYGRLWGFSVGLRRDNRRVAPVHRWHRVIGQLKRQVLYRVRAATSDAHEGLACALREAFPGVVWQRWQTHFRRNVIGQVPSGYRDRMHQITDHLLKASSQRDMNRRFEGISEEVEEKALAALKVPEGGLFDAAATEALLAEKHEE